MRQSVAPTRTSHAVSSMNHQPPNPAAHARLQEKKKEFEAVSALEKASAMFVKRIEGLGDDCDVMADAGLGKQCIRVYFTTLLILMLSPRASSGSVAEYVQDLEFILWAPFPP